MKKERILRMFRRFLLYVVMILMVVIGPSCGGSKNAPTSGQVRGGVNQKQLDKQMKRNPPPTDLDAIRKGGSKKVRKTLKRNEKREKQLKKESTKSKNENIKRHNEMQTKETRQRMKESKKTSEKNNKQSLGIFRKK